MTKDIVVLQTHRDFRLRLILATLSHTSIKIEKIRSDDLNPGLTDYEISFLRLLEALTNGSIIEISYTGTSLIYKPGLIVGGNLTFQCHESKAIGYYLEYILLLGPFAKKKFSIVFKGIDEESSSCSLEGVKWGLLPIMEKFGVLDVELHILKRGAAPKGGAEVHLMINQLLQTPLTLHALEIPKYSAIRGVCYSTRVSPSIVNRLVESCRVVFQNTGIKTDIIADAWRGENSGKSPSWGLTLVLELKKSGYRIFNYELGQSSDVPEDIGKKCALELFYELSRSGIVGKNQLKFALSFMLLGKEHIGRMIINKEQIDDLLIYFLRDVKKIMNGSEVHFKENEYDNDKNYLIMMVKGIGITNSNKKIA